LDILPLNLTYGVMGPIYQLLPDLRLRARHLDSERSSSKLCRHCCCHQSSCYHYCHHFQLRSLFYSRSLDVFFSFFFTQDLSMLPFIITFLTITNYAFSRLLRVANIIGNLKSGQFPHEHLPP